MKRPCTLFLIPRDQREKKNHFVISHCVFQYTYVLSKLLLCSAKMENT